MSRTPFRRTKIVATLGPAWETPERMAALLDDVSRGIDQLRQRLRKVAA